MTKAISNPRYSRPIDIHRWSDHPEAIRLADRLWTDYFADYADHARKPGPTPKITFKHQLRVLILDLYVAWLEDPELSIGLPMSANGWNSNSRYNALHLSKKLTDLAQRLHERGLIDLAPGSYSGPYAPGNRNSRIRAARPLQELFSGTKLREADIRHHEREECIVLKSTEPDVSSAHLVDYEDTPETNAMRTALQAYNLLLARTFIDIPTLEAPVIEHGVGEAIHTPLGPSRKFVRRIFNRGSWELNGRYYGGWWQQVGKDWRARIFLNDVPTVEVDFKGMHVAILSLEKGKALKGDPYELPENLIPGAPAELQRNLLKKLLLTAINARDRNSAFRSFRDGYEAGHIAKGLTNVELSALLDAFTAKHPHLADCLCSDQGIRLMNVDARIAERVINRFIKAGVPLLCVHDSFVVPYTHVRVLKAFMRQATRAVVGAELAVEANGPGLDELRDSHLYVQQDFVAWRQTERCAGYLARLADHEERWGG